MSNYAVHPSLRGTSGKITMMMFTVTIPTDASEKGGFQLRVEARLNKAFCVSRFRRSHNPTVNL